MKKRAILIVLDSVGIGALPDAAMYADEGSNTLVNIKKARPQTHLPNLVALGLGNIQGEEIALLGKVSEPKGAFGKMAERSAGKDTTAGHWELAGVVTETPFPTYTDVGFPAEVIDAFETAIGRSTLGNVTASGTQIIQELGAEHVRTGRPIVYTSADSVFQIAAHEDVIPLEELYRFCEIARNEILVGAHAVGRVIARPFVGEVGSFTRTKNRRDFSLSPSRPTVLDVAKAQGYAVEAVGKIEDIFAGQGMTFAVHTENNADGIAKTLERMQTSFEGILFTNLVDTDMIYGHRNDVEGYAKALEYFDAQLPELCANLQEGDLLFLTADHGCDPTTASIDHSREYVPILVYGKQVKAGVDLGIRGSFADVAETIAAYLGLGESFGAKSFLHELLE